MAEEMVKIKAPHRTMYFASRAEAENFLEGMRNVTIEALTDEEKKDWQPEKTLEADQQ